MRIPLFQADNPALPGDLLTGQSQQFFVEMKPRDAVPCTVERRAPAGMRPGGWYGGIDEEAYRNGCPREVIAPSYALQESDEITMLSYPGVGVGVCFPCGSASMQFTRHGSLALPIPALLSAGCTNATDHPGLAPCFKGYGPVLWMWGLFRFFLRRAGLNRILEVQMHYHGWAGVKLCAVLIVEDLWGPDRGLITWQNSER